MKNCDECYLMRQPQTEKCPHCGKMTWVGQVVGISMHWECSECGWCCISAGGFPPICHGDEELYNMVCKLGISCQIDNRIEKTYSRILKCPYA